MHRASFIAAAALLTLTALSVAAQPGANMDLPSLTGDVLDTGALNSGFNMLATGTDHGILMDGVRNIIASVEDK